jgi:hypothetical protein
MWLGLPVIVGLLVVVGCAKPPQADIDAARQALNAAKTPDATEYAPDSLSEAENAMALVDAELKTQQDKFALFRSYEKTAELVRTAKAAAEKSVADTAAAKEKARNEASQAINDVRTQLTEAKALLEQAPKGKGTQADIAAMKADLDGIEMGLSELDATFANQRYLDAKAKAASAMQNIQRIKADIQAAIDAKMGGKPRG